jgi:hypothetical protein
MQRDREVETQLIDQDKRSQKVWSSGETFQKNQEHFSRREIV